MLTAGGGGFIASNIFFQLDHVMDCCKDLNTRVSLTKINAAIERLHLCSHLGTVLGGDENNRGAVLNRLQPFAQIQTGHSWKLNVEHQAGKSRTFFVREKGFGREIRDGLKVRGPEQTAHRETDTVVVINDRDIDVLSLLHKRSNNRDGLGCHLPFREGWGEGREGDEEIL